MDREKVIKELHDARRYLEDKEWSDRGASPHIDAINDALALLKEQEAVVRCKDCKYCDKRNCADGYGWCNRNGEGHGTTDDWFCADGERKDS